MLHTTQEGHDSLLDFLRAELNSNVHEFFFLSMTFRIEIMILTELNGTEPI